LRAVDESPANATTPSGAIPDRMSPRALKKSLLVGFKPEARFVAAETRTVLSHARRRGKSAGRGAFLTGQE
jgi:hypothetical protein